MTVVKADANFKLASGASSSLSDVSDPLPDTDGACTGSAPDMHTGPAGNIPETIEPAL